MLEKAKWNTDGTPLDPKYHKPIKINLRKKDDSSSSGETDSSGGDLATDHRLRVVARRLPGYLTRRAAKDASTLLAQSTVGEETTVFGIFRRYYRQVLQTKTSSRPMLREMGNSAFSPGQDCEWIDTRSSRSSFTTSQVSRNVSQVDQTPWLQQKWSCWLESSRDWRRRRKAVMPTKNSRQEWNWTEPWKEGKEMEVSLLVSPLLLLSSKGNRQTRGTRANGPTRESTKETSRGSRPRRARSWRLPPE